MTSGYGQIGVKGVHRVFWELHNNKKIPNGLFVLHKCVIKSCVNPEHLFLGTPKDNTQDAMRKGRLYLFPKLKKEKHPRWNPKKKRKNERI